VNRNNNKRAKSLFLTALFLLSATTLVSARDDGFDDDFGFDEAEYNRAQGRAEGGFGELDQTDMETGDRLQPKAPITPPPTIVIIKAPAVVRRPAPISPLPQTREIPVPSPVAKRLTETGAGIAFQFEYCRKRGNEIECHFNLTSQYFDREVFFGRHYGYKIFLYDNMGNQYISSKIKLAGKESRGKKGKLYKLAAQLIADITVPSTLYFNNISTQATSIAKLEINSAAKKSGKKEKFTLKYRKLAFTTE
jgi:hypothetical protein